MPERFYARHNADRLEMLTLLALRTLAEHQQTVEDAIRAGHDDRRRRKGEVEANRLTLLESREALSARHRELTLMQLELRLAKKSTLTVDQLLDECSIEQEKVETDLLSLGQSDTDVSLAGSPRETAAKLARMMQAVIERLSAPDEEFPSREKRKLLQTLVERIIPTDTGLELRLRHDIVTYVLEQGGPDVQQARLRVKLTAEEGDVCQTLTCRIHCPPYSLDVDLLAA